MQPLRIAATSKRTTVITSVSMRNVAEVVSTASKSGSLSSCRSRLYVSGSPFSTVRSVTRSPMTRPLRPRASSATSAFFFCGINDEPVAWLSGRLAKPNSVLDQSTSSSPSREQCTIVSAHADVMSTVKSRSATASMLFDATRAKPSSCATRSRSSGSVEPASAPLPSGNSSHASMRGAETQRVAREHLDVRKQVMREGGDLRALEMRVSRHRRASMLGRAPNECLLETGHCEQQIRARPARPHAQVGGDLIVAAASRVQHPGDRTRKLEEAALDGGVDVLITRSDHEVVAGQLRRDRTEPGVERAMLRAAEHTDAAEHARVRSRPGDVVGAETAVNGEAGRVALDASRRGRAQPARPDLGGARSARRALVRRRHAAACAARRATARCPRALPGPASACATASRTAR